MLSYIDRFGAQAVTGGAVLSGGNLRRMVAAENVVKAYRSRTAATNWQQWYKDNPDAGRLLTLAEKELSNE